ncbi:translational GTPase TypA [Acidithiobacillus sp. AMEEHan]|uniref:translational GTPase TypA n=1 Tax=Acidithiobacillus sp. AMEEHan TaxID=2994951 RepID=UPI0027E42DD9|nr:translational GTPase TypA [Acidithiobacillus sp. AMEEHan]
MSRQLRNIAIIAHVDHGKTTLVDQLLKQSGTFAAHQQVEERVMDSNALEKERGITIMAKNTAVQWGDTHINIVDTPGHADFGAEVERVLGMVDGVLLLVDAVEGPMPQTRFVTRKALELGLRPIVVINKIDRPGARPDYVISATLDLFDKLGATEEQLDFPVLYASGLQGYAGEDPSVREGDMRPLFELILSHVSAPEGNPDAPLQMQIADLDYSSYVGQIAIGRVHRGRIRPGQDVVLIQGQDAKQSKARILQVLGFDGLKRVPWEEGASVGDIVAITGIESPTIGATIAAPEAPEALPWKPIDEPTLNMTFQVNTSPFAGREGKFVTSRQLRERLYKELLINVALRVADTENPDVFLVSGRGELHLTVLIENMRREGYELAVSRPRVIQRVVDGVPEEPYESLTIDVEEIHQGAIMERMGTRRGELLDMQPDGRGRVRLEYRIPARGLIGFHTEFMTTTSGTGVMSHIFDGYGPVKGAIPTRINGVLISAEEGEAVGYALFNLQDRGRLFIGPGDKVYEGMVIGIHSRDNDLVVNPLKEKKLTNMRASGSDENILLTPPIRMSLEAAVEFIDDDELVEVTPESIRVRKRYLKENERKKAARSGA